MFAITGSPASYDMAGFFPNVVFTCGTILMDDQLLIYYGAADASVALVEMSLDDLWHHHEQAQ
jgi:predicted GH43/DUF377 family glycosyl hydrolase